MDKFGNLITRVINQFTTTIEGAILENFATLNTYVFPVWVSGISVYFIFKVYLMIYQDKDLDIQEFIKQMVVIALVTTFLGTAGKGGAYTSYLIPFVMDSGESLSSVIMEGDGAQSLVESLFKKTTLMINDIWDSAGEDTAWYEPGDTLGAYALALVQSILLFIGGVLLSLFAFVYIVITKLMIGILLSLGGIFIMFSAFPSTRQMFTAWIGSCLNYIFLNVSFSVCFSIIMKVIDSYVGGIFTSINILETIAIAFLYLAGILMLQQVTVLTSTLTGGVGINGLTSAVRSALPEKTLASIGKGTWNKTGGAMAKNTARWGVDVGKSMLGKNNTIRG